MSEGRDMSESKDYTFTVKDLLSNLRMLGDHYQSLSLGMESGFGCRADDATAVIRAAESLIWQVPRWIPVSERMPDEGERVMVSNATDGWVTIGSRKLTGAYHHWDGDDHEELCEPTHWMPLPEPPEVK